MNRNAKKLSRAVLVGYARRDGRRSKSLRARGRSSAIGHLGPAIRNSNARHRAKLGKANPHFFSLHNSRANDASVFGFAEAGMAWGNPETGVYKRQGRRS
jgi:hypothetical protein